MLIIWGKTIRRRDTGFAAGFCPVCRDVTYFDVKSVRSVDHLYYIPMGRGKHIVDELTCTGCRMLRGWSPGHVRPVPAPDRTADALDVAAHTGPMSLQDLTDRLEIESRLAEGKLTPQERIELGAEPIQALTYAHQVRLAGGSRASASAVLQLLLIAGLVASVLMWFNHFGAQYRQPPPVWPITITLTTAALLGIVLFRFSSDRRATAKGALEPLGTALASIHPPLERHEVEAAIRLAAQSGSSLAKTLTPEQVFSAIHRAAPHPHHPPP